MPPHPLFDPSIDKLSVLIEEVMRATPEGVKRFIEPANGVLARAKSNQHQIVFGRRGSGKSSLLRKVVADLTVVRRPIAYVDMETFKSHTYPDVLISVLVKSLKEFKGWLDSAAIAPSNKPSFWNRLFGEKPKCPPLNKHTVKALSAELGGMLESLELQLLKPEQASVQTKHQRTGENSNAEALGVALKTSVGDISASTNYSHKGATLAEEQLSYISHKVEFLHQKILNYQDFFSRLGMLSDGHAVLVLDDLYHIRRSDQAKVIDYFHRVAKGNKLWLKIGTIKHRTDWYIHGNPPIGLKLGDDASEVNLDLTLEQYRTSRKFLQLILEQLVGEVTNFNVNELINTSAIDRLVVASGGVARDFLGIFGKALIFARERGEGHHRGQKIGVEDVNKAAGEYDPNKREEFKLDTDEDRVQLESEFQKIVGFCTEQAKCNVFLVHQKTDSVKKALIDQLVDLRLVHLVKSRVTTKSTKAGELFEAYMLDLSQYTAARKIHDMHLVDLSKDEANDEIRRNSLVYTESRAA
jgi:hypothetical protein